MKKKGLFFIGILIISLTILFEGNLMFNSESVKADENNIKEITAKFSSKSPDKINIINEKVIGGKKVYQLDDGSYTYQVNEIGQINKITRKDIGKIKSEKKISNDNALSIAEKNLGKLSTKFTKYTTKVEEKNLENNKIYTILFEEKNNEDNNTGSYIYIDLLDDGQLLGLQINIEDSKLIEKAPKLEKQKASNIITTYFNEHKILKNHTNKLNNGDYTLKLKVFHGVPVWELSLEIPEITNDNFIFSYLIDANTGEFVYISEPKAPGFDLNPEVQKRLENILSTSEVTNNP